MDWDDVKPTPPKAATIGEDLKTFSVGDLEARVAVLRAEIERVERELVAKKTYEAAAAELFKR